MGRGIRAGEMPALPGPGSGRSLLREKSGGLRGHRPSQRDPGGQRDKRRRGRLRCRQSSRSHNNRPVPQLPVGQVLPQPHLVQEGEDQLQKDRVHGRYTLLDYHEGITLQIHSSLLSIRLHHGVGATGSFLTVRTVLPTTGAAKGRRRARSGAWRNDGIWVAGSAVRLRPSHSRECPPDW